MESEQTVDIYMCNLSGMMFFFWGGRVGRRGFGCDFVLCQRFCEGVREGIYMYTRNRAFFVSVLDKSPVPYRLPLHPAPS